MVDIDDHVLWVKARQGDAEAFGSLFERHCRSIYAYCFRRTGDWSLAEDLTSVTFLEAWRRRHVDLQHDKVGAWLYGIATNVVRNQRRAMLRYASALQRVPSPDPECDFASDVTDRLVAEQQMREVLYAISELPLQEQEVIALCAWQGLSHADSAFALGVPEATVRTRMFRARRRLRDRLSETRAPDFELASDGMERNDA